MRDAFLEATPIVDWSEPRVLGLARRLTEGRTTDVEVARSCFEWVRDQVRHTVDHGLDRITCSASEVLEARTGFCYAKSHLLAAILRANAIPAGFVYQRLSLDEAAGTFCLHGLNAVWLSGFGWYRVDARGDREDLRAGFEPPHELLPFSCRLPGERMFPVVYSEPLAIVCDALRRYETPSELERHLPDAT